MRETIALPGYEFVEKIAAGVGTIIYRATRTSDNRSVVVKLLSSEHPTIEEIGRLKQEFIITQHLVDCKGVIKAHALEKYKNGFALVLEDLVGTSMKQMLGEPMHLADKLRVGLALANTLAEIHRLGVIHKDIKPSNILINHETGQVRLIDFGIASRLSQENPIATNPNAIEGTLVYMPPEQTGRTNRTLDYRCDYYALGVTMYEILTGTLPFNSNDPMELVHCHLAVEPIPPHQLKPEISEAISAIVMKLLAKNAEDRYQSAAGLKYDLEKCLTQLAKKGKIDRFVPGERDRGSQLLIPQKLYGREREVEMLLQAFERAIGTEENSPPQPLEKGEPEEEVLIFKGLTDGISRGAGRSPAGGADGTDGTDGTDGAEERARSEMVLVSGYSGIGKTAIVNEIQKPIVRQRGYFISGKFDQFKRNIPYAALVQAFSELISELLTESPQKVAEWQEKILKAIAPNAKIIIDAIPEVELIIGSQRSVPQVGPTESQNRFNRVFQQFVGVFTRQEHPLVLFLDDLQWADSASLKLIHLLASNPDSKYFLLIGAYRDNEVNPTHPLVRTIAQIQEDGGTVNQLSIAPLELSHVSQLAIETLGESRDSKKIKPLAELIFQKTQGNPFFVTQLLKSLYSEKLLVYDVSSDSWQWDLLEIQAIGIADGSVVELLARSIDKLHPSTKSVLQLAACIGDRFSLEVLSIASEQPQPVTAAKLWEALQVGLVLPMSKNYKIPSLFAGEENKLPNASEFQVYYRFLHDRVQQAAYSLIPEALRQQTHHKIGQLLLRNTTQEEKAENIFAVVNQLNYGLELIPKQQEKDELAEMNLIAGKKAKASAAHEAAVNYLNIGLGLLGIDAWEKNYGLTLALHVEAVEAEYLNSNFERSDELAEIAISNAKSLLEKVKVFEIKIQSCIAGSKMTEAIELGLKVLEMLGVSIEEEPPMVENIEELANLPVLKDREKEAAERILNSVGSAAFITDPALTANIAFTKVAVCTKYGNSQLATSAYTDYGVLLCGAMVEIESGYRFGKLGLMLLEQFDAKELKSIALNIFNSHIRFWKEHLRETLEGLLESFFCGQETGELVYSGYAALSYCTNLFFVGEHLEVVEQKHAEYLDKLQKLKLVYHLGYGQIGRQLTLNLLGRTKNQVQLIGEAFNELEALPMLIKYNVGTALVYAYLAKAILAYLFKEPKQAVAAAQECEKYLQAATGMVTVAENNFYYSLALLAACADGEKERSNEYLQQVEINQEKMKIWAEHAPMNFQHKYDLVEAEKAKIFGKNPQAMEYYDRAIVACRKEGFTHEEALAYELAGEFYIKEERENLARYHLIESYYGYLRWGAIAKTKDLQKRYPGLLMGVKMRYGELKDIGRTLMTTTTHSGNFGLLDWPTVIKMAQAISQEIVLGDLLDNLIKIAMENAGAQKGLLILDPKENLEIVAAGKVKKGEIVIERSLLGELTDAAPQTIINYVKRTGKSVVLDDAKNDLKFNFDEYIIEGKVLSVLCTPILNRGKLMGVVYLENNSIAAAFTKERLELLNVLSSQAAISLENAVLYANLEAANKELLAKNAQLEEYSSSLEEKVAERTLELEEKNKNLSTTLRELRRTQAQMIHTEKMSSLGRMVAGIAHEINNPVNFIYGNISYTKDYMRDLVDLIELYQKYYPDAASEIIEKIEEIEFHFLKEDLPELLSSMKKGSDRIRNIVLSLRNFSRLDESELKWVDLHLGINSTLLILQYRLSSIIEISLEDKPEDSEEVLKQKGIRVIKKYGNLPKVECYSGQLNQVFMNVLSNAIDALELAIDENKFLESTSNCEDLIPTICINTYLVGSDRVAISIKDNGLGIKKEISQKLFDPFFTTKPVGKGTGLGLSVCYSIVVDKHGGKIDCLSQPGKGAEFIMEIPIKQPKN